MPLTSLLLVPLFCLLPGLAFLVLTGPASAHSSTGSRDRYAGPADLLFLSVALSGWMAQTLALAGWFTLPALALTVTMLSLAALCAHRGIRSGFVQARRLALSAVRPRPAALAAGLCVLLLAVLLYHPPGVAQLDGHPAPAISSLGIHLARTGALPRLAPGSGLDGAAEAMRAAAGPGLLFPAWTGLLQLLGGSAWSAAAPAIFAALSLAVIFGLGRHATGSAWFGALLLLALGLNYPQAWLARVSVPESAAQFLVLASARFYLRSRDGLPGVGAAAVCLGAALLCAPALLWFTPPALLLLLALHTAGSPARRRRAVLFSLGVLPFLAQGWLQALLPGIGHAVLPALPGGSAHWMVWYLTLPFLVLLACGLLLMLVRPAWSLRLVGDLGPLIPLALVSLPVLLRSPGSDAVQPWAARPFTVALIPSSLFVGLFFFHRTLQWLRHPALRLIWCSFLAVMLGLNLANLLPMATGRPGQGAVSLVWETARPLAHQGRPFTAVVEAGLGRQGLHSALTGLHGIRSFSLGGHHPDRERFHALVRENAATGRRTALVIENGLFTPDPAGVTLRPLATAEGTLVQLPPLTDHLPSSVVTRLRRLQIFEALPAAPQQPTHRAPLTVCCGVYQEDWPWLDSGFHGISSAGGRPHRWTASLARLRVPSWAAAVELTLGGFRPPGAPDAFVSAGFAGHPPTVNRQLPRVGFVTFRVSRPVTGRGSLSSFLELHSTVFDPQSWFTELDGDQLGLQLASMTYFPADRSPPVPPAVQ